MNRRPYQYVVLRWVPRVDREEFVNVGVVLYCEADGYLGCASHLEPARISALAPGAEAGPIRDALAFVAAVCAGDEAAGAVAARPAGQRFGFVKAPRSTSLQPGPVHGGLTVDPAVELTRLLDRLVRSADPGP